ncbi:MAG: hypothetical protein HOO96_27980 [Polyangiaceae bacterium]|nr:hypothetical protein [Polyangiaceae bacterium]
MKRAALASVGLAAAGVLLQAALAFAQERADAPKEARLSFEAPKACPDEGTLARDVASRLGYEPFRASATTGIAVTITAKGPAFAGRIEVTDAAGKVQGRRELPTERDCAELVHAAAFAVAIVIDPLRAQQGPAPLPSAPPSASSAPVAVAPPAPTPSPPPAPTPSQPTPASTAPSDPVHLHAAAGMTFSALRVPSLGLGARIEVGLRQRRWSVSLEGQSTFPLGDEQGEGGAVSASLVSALAVPCLHAGILGACALVELGALQGTGRGVDVPKRDTTVLFALGARVMAEVFLASWLYLRPAIDLLAPVTRTTLRIGERPVWTTPPLGLTGSVSVGTVFR